MSGVSRVDDLVVESVSAVGVISDWLAKFESAVGRVDGGVLELFGAECWWRDFLAASWDVRTMCGAKGIDATVGDQLATVGFRDLVVNDELPAHMRDGVVEGSFDFATNVARGRGVVRLRQDAGVWKAWTLLTKVDDLIDYPELRTTLSDALRPDRGDPRDGHETWYEFRERQREFVDREPDVLVVGAGHAGLATTARMQHMGLSTLLVEKTARVGDVWRQRYNNLTLHDTKFFNNMPYLNFPDNWPLFAPKELVGDWFEAYAWILQLNVWTGTEIVGAVYEESSGRWNVELRRDGQSRVVHPKHIVFAIGAVSGNPRQPAVPGVDSFNGRAVHSSAYQGGPEVQGKRVVVVGAGSTGLDVAQDAHESGAEVTMVQRGPTYVMSTEHGIPMMLANYAESGISNDAADLISLSYPTELYMRDIAPSLTRAIARQDDELLEGLRRAGFETTLGPDDTGLIGQRFVGRGGTYIEKGCSKLIAEQKIKIRRGEVAQFTSDGITLTDGSEVMADIVVFATGYSDVRDVVSTIVGDDLASKLPAPFQLDHEGELGVARPSGHPGLWFMGGGFKESRYGTKILALQIKAREEGLIHTPR